MKCYLYLLVAVNEQVNKVGVTEGDLVSRFASIQTTCPYVLDFKDAWEFEDKSKALEMERLVLESFGPNLTTGEWIKCSHNEAWLQIYWLMNRAGYPNKNVVFDAVGSVGSELDWRKIRMWVSRNDPKLRARLIMSGLIDFRPTSLPGRLVRQDSEGVRNGNE